MDRNTIEIQEAKYGMVTSSWVIKKTGNFKATTEDQMFCEPSDMNWPGSLNFKSKSVMASIQKGKPYAS